MFKFFAVLLFFSFFYTPAFSDDDVEEINQYCVEIDNSSEELSNITVSGSNGEDVVAYYKDGFLVRIFVDFISSPRSQRIIRDYYIKSGVLLKVTEMVRISETGSFTELFYKDENLFHVIQNDVVTHVDDPKIVTLSGDATTKLDEYLLLIQ